jgi:ribosomal protein L11 methyltransferase
MPWLQVSIQISPEQAEQYEDALLEAGALSVTVTDAADQPVLEPGPGETPLWQHCRVTGLFQDNINANELETRLHHALSLETLPELLIEPLEDQDWTRAWMEHFKPMAFGNRLWVCPEGFEPPEPGAINLMMDPGLAFGTGTHPTTALCLEWIDQQDMQDRTVVDYGCGSGILAIAALLCGASRAWGVDNDPQALIATRDNAKKNHVSERIECFLPGDFPGTQADICMANILAGPLTELAPLLANIVKPGGSIILSGILSHQANEISTAYQEWFVMEPVTLKEDWARLEGTRK